MKRLLILKIKFKQKEVALGLLVRRMSFITRRVKQLGELPEEKLGMKKAVVACHKEEKAGKSNLAYQEDKTSKSLTFRDDKICISRKCQIKRLTVGLHVEFGLTA